MPADRVMVQLFATAHESNGREWPCLVGVWEDEAVSNSRRERVIKELHERAAECLAALKTFRSEDDWPEMLRALAPLAPFARHKADYGYMQPGPAPSKDFQSRKFPSLPAKLLARLEPDRPRFDQRLARAATPPGPTRAEVNH